MRGGRGRVVGLSTDLGQSVLACFGTDHLLELFVFCSDSEAKQRMDKRIKKQKKKLQYVFRLFVQSVARVLTSNIIEMLPYF